VASIIKVDRIQSDTGTVNLASNISFTGTGNRIRGDFSNATLTERVAFQNSVLNNNTFVSFIPNGTASLSNLHIYNNSDITNASFLSVGMSAGGAEARLNSTVTGTAPFMPMTFFTGGTESLRLSHTSKAVILAGGDTGANGTGITFPASQNASSNANTLDDYEEGTWTPTDTSGAGLTFPVSFAYYTKVGRVVFISGEVAWPSTANGSAASISLPFAASNTTRSFFSGTAMNNANQNLNSFVDGVSLGNSLTFYIQPGGVFTQTNNATLSTRFVYFNVIYLTT
jgi:hypothetical protein